MTNEGIKRAEAAIAKDDLNAPSPIDFSASHPAHVERGKAVKQDTSAWAVPGELPSKPYSPGKAGKPDNHGKGGF